MAVPKENTRQPLSSSASESSPKWWVPIFMAAIYPLLLVGFIVVAGFSLRFLPDLAIEFALSGVFFLTVIKLGSPIAVYFDKQYVAAHGDWNPSRWYYLTFLGLIGSYAALLYMSKRRKSIGHPKYLFWR